MKSAFLSPKGPWLLVLAALVFFACLVAIQASPATTAAWPYWPAVKLALQAGAVVVFVLLLCHAFKVDVTIEAEKVIGSGTSCSYSYSSDSGNLASIAEMHRKSLELKAIQTVVQAAVLNGQREAGEMARAAIDQLVGTGSLEYAKAALDESARTRASINQAFAAMQACTCKGNDACSNCPPQRFSPVQTPRAADKEAVIQDKGETATHITPADIEASIAAEYSFTLDKALIGCPLVDGLDRVTLSVIVLRNCTKLVGVNYGAIDPARHDPEMGRKEARSAAIEQIWPLMGYELRTKLATATT